MLGLVLAMPITATLKLVCQTVPELNRWAELMSVDWQSPRADDPEPAAVDAPQKSEPSAVA